MMAITLRGEMADEMDNLGWTSISALARAIGRDKGGVSRRVSRLESQGLLTTRRSESGQKLIDRAEFDRVASETVDAIQQANGSRRAAPAADMGDTPDPILAKEQARKTRIAADLAQIELDRRHGLLVPLDDVQSAARTVAERLRRGVEQMGSRAEEVASGQTSPFAAALIAALRLDPAGARIFFKTLGRAQLSALAAAAAMFDADDMDEPPALAASLSQAMTASA
jgi:DNA-binding MarR family transcriptional regulator